MWSLKVSTIIYPLLLICCIRDTLNRDTHSRRLFYLRKILPPTVDKGIHTVQIRLYCNRSHEFKLNIKLSKILQL